VVESIIKKKSRELIIQSEENLRIIILNNKLKILKNNKSNKLKIEINFNKKLI
jgi:hypothetical protein